MTDICKQKPVRVPVKLVDGRWEYFYGGNIPVKNGAIGELILNEGAIDNKEFLKSLNRKSQHKILDIGAKLLVALTINAEPELDGKLREHLQTRSQFGKEFGTPYFNIPLSPNTQFVEVTVDGCENKGQIAIPELEGGLWLNVKGLQPKGLVTSYIKLPDGLTNDPVISLNHAFTILSEHYEPWRKSHTGNVYERVFYQEKNGNWYQLEILRNRALAKDEHELIKERWDEISVQLNLKIN